ncbi:hypothetical protein JN01_0152 [Entomoplasma freundtii]|uniref:Uncharacterized protein n=1 Tax=Entomoplasma freundtii TaxID=74700 RepID=A0A2K8NS79_9MOLU|nr:hypothetical protein [Entomoplasma freundtii]ATZ16627.1 hypothetical protein EFREU_v1c06070 [Entomoplasma freundtii]TDY58206.1 hypothetical protein JN01_0152 [Entomoplasma freundtii]
MKRGARQSVLSALVGVCTSIMASLIQFLMIYWILKAYGSAFTGFTRITIALTIVGGSAEGALGLTTVVMLVKPMAQEDWLQANEIISTATKKYHKNVLTASVLICLIAILYPLQIALFPKILDSSRSIVWGIEISDSRVPGGQILISVWELGGIVIIFGLMRLIASKYFGIYENIIIADQKNGVRKVIILFVDTVVYGCFLLLLNRAIDGQHFLHPIIPLTIFLAYAPLRGFLMFLYVKRYYPWIKFYADFTSYPLLRTTSKVWRAGLGQSLLINADLIILFLVLLTPGLTVTSMLSLYMLVGVNLRLILTSMITSFREYFIVLVNKDGRLQWDTYSKYELYTFIVAAFAFIFMSLIAPYIVTGLYGDLIYSDLLLDTGSSPFLKSAQWKVFDFIFTSPVFSIIYATSVSFILLFQGQTILIQAKGRFGEVAKGVNIIALVYFLTEIVICLTVNLVMQLENIDEDFLKDTILSFYIIKILFMTMTYVYLWQYTWKYVTYNSTSKYIFSNLCSLLMPITAAILINLFFVSKKFPLTIDPSTGPPIVSIGLILGILLIVVVLGAASCLALPLFLRPSVGVSMVLSLPVIKQIVALRREKSRKERFAEQNINLEAFEGQQRENLAKVLYNIDQRSATEIISEKDFLKRYQNNEKPKIYQIKGSVKRLINSSSKTKKKEEQDPE